MGFVNDLARFAARTDVRLQRYVQHVQDEAYAELEKRLADVLPEQTPMHTGKLARGYKFRIENEELVVSNDQFYALAVARFGGRYDLVETVQREAEAIVNDRTFRLVVQERARKRLG